MSISGVSGASLTLPVHRLRAGLLLVTAILGAAHVLAKVLEHGWGFPHLQRVDMDEELSVATWFATLLLSGCAGSSMAMWLVTRRTGEPFAWFWFGLGALFGYAALDEAVMIHELLVYPLRQLLGISSGWLFYAWVVPGAGALVVVTALYRPFIFALPSATRRGLLTGVGLLVLGGLGLEFVGGWYVSTRGDTMAYALISGGEEVLELSGAIIVLTTFLAHIDRHVGGLHLTFPSQAPRGAVARHPARVVSLGPRRGHVAQVARGRAVRAATRR